MTLDPSAVVTIALAGVGLVGTASGWAIRSYVTSQIAPVQSQLAKHEEKDELIHTHVSQTLADIKHTTGNTDAKVDRLIERLL